MRAQSKNENVETDAQGPCRRRQHLVHNSIVVPRRGRRAFAGPRGISDLTCDERRRIRSAANCATQGTARFGFHQPMKLALRRSPFVLSLLLVALSGCSTVSAVRAQTASPSVLASRPAFAPPRERLATTPAPLPSLTDGDADCVFVKNALLAIEQYRMFIEHAGHASEYATAVTRSQDAIDDLRAEIDFVRAGMPSGVQCHAEFDTRAEQARIDD